MSKILLIGNSPSVMRQKCGKQINKFQHIVRFNNFQIEGFEEFVGTRLDIWCMSSSGKVERKADDFKRIWIPENLRNTKNGTRIAKLHEQYPNIEMIPAEFCNWLDLTIGLKGQQWSTTGTYALAWALEQFEEVWIFGLDLFGSVKSGDMAPHYFQHVGDEKIGAMHSLEKERAYLQDLIAQGKVKELSCLSIQ